MSAEDVANAFVQHYHSTFDSQGAGALAPLFNEGSYLTFEGNQLHGGQAIIQKLSSIGPVSHQVQTTDVQPSSNQNAICIFVTGNIRIGGPDGNPIHFCEFFQLVSTAPGAYYVHNCIFRLNYA